MPKGSSKGKKNTMKDIIIQGRQLPKSWRFLEDEKSRKRSNS